ncbi:MAG: ATPase domain-containing protein [Candidatus Methanofastidiosia archaeon]
MNDELTPMDILQEHLPSGISVLIVGPPGSGKTILSQQLVHHLLKKGKFAIYIGSKPQMNLITHQKRLFTWDVAKALDEKLLSVVEIGDVADPTELNISLTQAIKKSEHSLSLVVMDSLTVLMVGMEHQKIMKFTEALERKLQAQNVSLLLLATPTKETEDFLTKMKSLVSLVIEIKLRERGNIRRYMRIFKFAERKHSTQWYPFEISDEGIQFPAAPIKAPAFDGVVLPKMWLLEDVATPYTELDELLDRIKRKKLSCIVEALLPSGQGVMLFSRGELLTSVIIGKDGNRSKAPELLEESIKTKRGKLTVHSIHHDITSLLVGYLEDQVLFRNLSSEQIKFEGILENLEESEFSGCVLMRGDEEQGLLFIDEGKVVEAYFEDESTLHSKEALSAFEDAASRGNFQVDIYYMGGIKKGPEERKAPPAKEPEAVLPELIPVKGQTVQGQFIIASLKYLQEENSVEWSSSVYYPRPLEDIAISKVENEILRLKAMHDPYLKRDTYKLRRGYRPREWYPVKEYKDIVYAATRMLEFSWPYDNPGQYEEGWGKLSKAYFEFGKTVPACMGSHKKVKKAWLDYFIREIQKWKDMGSFSEMESKKEDNTLKLKFIGDIELPPRRKGMLWGLLEALGLSKFHIDIEGDEYCITFG